jgi:hypothetical protein
MILNIKIKKIKPIPPDSQELCSQWQLDFPTSMCTWTPSITRCRGTAALSPRPAYICIGIDANGYNDHSVMWIGESEGANFGLAILT